MSMRAAWLAFLAITLGLGTAFTGALAADPSVNATEEAAGRVRVIQGGVAITTGLTPVLGVDPESLDFGRVCLNEQSELVVELFNANEDPASVVEVTDLAIQGQSFSLVNPPATPFTLVGGNPAPRTPVTVRFAPTAPGPDTGSFVITSDAANSPTSVALAGVGNTLPLCDNGGPYIGTIGQPVAFDGSGSSDPDGDALTYSWDFGDGTTGTGATPTHTYATSGTFTVTLSVSDDCGSSQCETTATISDEPNDPPICDANGPYSGTVGQPVSFDGSGSNDPDGTVDSYAWDFGDGSTDTGSNPTHTYLTSGSFTVTLTVTDNDGASSTCTTTAEIGDAPNEPPVCDANGPYSGTVGQPVSFDGSGSNDPDGTVDSYAWDFGDGSTDTGSNPTHTYLTSGTFTVTLTVTDNDGASSTCTTTAEIGEAPNEPPVCDANGPYNGTVGQPVSFDGSGSSDPDGTVDSYVWDFGDGSTDTGSNPTHTYAAPGTFTVTLTVTDNDGASSTCETTANITAEPNEPPICDANGPYSGTVGQPVSFDGSGSSDPDGTIDSYVWDFGDGSTDTGSNPTHTYQTSGSFTVTLTVTDNDGGSSSCTTTAEIGDAPNEPPVCDANGPYSGTVGQPVSFDGSGSSDPDGTVDSYVWDFGDGSTDTGSNPTHTYAAPGSFTVTLTVTDNDGASSTCTTTAEIGEAPNEPPVCDANGPYNGTVGVPVTFDGSGSSDPDGTVDSYVWDFGDGSTDTGVSPSHTYVAPGNFTVTLTITDNDGASSTCTTTANITAEPNEPPICDANGPYTGTVGQPVSFDGSGSSDPDGTIDSYVWDFGDGSTDTGSNPTHTYQASGSFTVTLTVTDNEGGTSTCTTTAEIGPAENQPPVCDANGPYSGTVGQPVSFDGSGSNDPDGTIDSYAWDFGDGSTDTGSNPTHTYQTSGSFTVTLTVTDNQGASSTCTTTAEIQGTGDNQPPDCSDAAPSRSEIWPPNNAFVSVGVIGVTDPDGDPVTITIDGVTQDEPLQGSGFGSSCPDAQRVNGGIQLRAERGSQADGRVYEISFTATDGRGGSCSGTVTVCVPKSQSPHIPCVDSGQDFDSFGPCENVRVASGTATLGLAANVITDHVVLGYELPEDAEVDLAIFDVTGRRVAVLENSHQSRGAHEISWDARHLARGVYYVRLEAQGTQVVKRLVLLR
jgi:PKD repeat protein